MMNTETESPSVTICILTYRRADMLRRALAALSKLVFIRVPQCQPSILVVENEANGGGEAACKESGCNFPLTYICEPKAGISHARNTALRNAMGHSDFIAFIDDDEIPDTDWLDNLLDAMLVYKADAVCGPVLSVYPESVPMWVVNGRFFERQRVVTGSVYSDGRTGNVLLRTKTLLRLAIWFDPGFAESGAEDTHFFKRLQSAGGLVVWADDACVHETVTEARATVGWLAKRAYQGGNGFTFVMLAIHPGTRTYFGRAGSSVVRILIGIATFPIAVFYGRHSMVKALQSITLGAGALAALLGLRYRAYGSGAERRA
jgi:succinoglycan biosynthesis protein ExoM